MAAGGGWDSDSQCQEFGAESSRKKIQGFFKEYKWRFLWFLEGFSFKHHFHHLHKTCNGGLWKTLSGLAGLIHPGLTV